jgi:hypothetical protein
MTNTSVGKVCEALWLSHEAVGKTALYKVVILVHLFMGLYDFNKIL